MSMASGSKARFQPGSWMEAVHDTYMGGVVGAAHSLFFWKRWVHRNIVNPLLQAFGVDLPHEKVVESSDRDKTLRVIGVGFGRTGTYSLTLALEELGFPTLHTQHLYEHERIIEMWTNKIFLPSIEDGKTRMGKPDLQLIADHGYQGTADLPMALYFEQIMEEYPECKFILTTRESSEVWFRSWETLTSSIESPTHFGGFFFSNVKYYFFYLRWLFSVVNKDDVFLAHPFPFPEQKKESAIASYEEHNRRVRQIIPAERLLEFNVKDGWEPLCSFMEIAECPSTPFPKTNSARSVQVQAISALVTPLAIVLFILFYLFSLSFQKATGRTVLQWANLKRLQLLESLRNAMVADKKRYRERRLGNSSYRKRKDF